MRVHVLRVPAKLQPAEQPFRYPRHNADYGIEQDFLAWLGAHPSMLGSVKDSDVHYLPVYWTRWHLSHDYGRTGIAELQSAVSSVLVDPARTFTVCQYDDGPLVSLGSTRIFLGSRQGVVGHDAPLLSSAHSRPRFVPRKRFLASFVGRLATHPLRADMARTLANEQGYVIEDRDGGPRRFVRRIIQSRVALAPRGSGGSSFRFFEAMQLGVVPLLLSDVDTRPFKRHMDWEGMSLYSSSAEDIPALISEFRESELAELGAAAHAGWASLLGYGRWCELVLAELEQASRP